MSQKKYRLTRVNREDRTKTEGVDEAAIEDIIDVSYDRKEDLYCAEYFAPDGIRDGWCSIEDAREIAKAKGIEL